MPQTAVYKHKIPFINIERYECDSETVQSIPEEMARSYQVVGIQKFYDTVIGQLNLFTMGMVNPKDNTAVSILENKFNCKVIPFAIDIEEWAKIINKTYERKEA